MLIILIFMRILKSARSRQKRDLDLKLDRISPFSKRERGILGCKSVLNLATCK